MNSRERVMAAVEHREPDRVPIDFGGSMVTSIHKAAYQKLKEHLSINTEKEIDIARGRSLVAAVDPEVQDFFDVDTRMLIAASPDGWLENRADRDRLVDEWGIAWEIPAGFTNYEITRSPLWGNISLNDVRSYRWPDPHLNMLPLENIRKQAETLRENPQKAVIANLALQIHTQSYFLRGFSDYLTDMILQPAVIEAIMDGVLDIFTERARIILSQIGDLVDIVYVADDLGTQNGPLFSPELYRKILKPRQKILFETIKKNSGVKILYHSCGSVVEFIDDLVEIGVDILNPVQVSAGGMDSRELKRKFGHKVCFWGAIDTQKILPFGTPSTVKAEVNKRLADLKDGGGFVAAAVHNIRPEVPPENIVAMIEAVKEFGVY